MTEITDAQVHAMCAYYRCPEEGPACHECPSRTSTPYGEGELGCYGLAKEMLEKAREILVSGGRGE